MIDFPDKIGTEPVGAAGWVGWLIVAAIVTLLAVIVAVAW